MASTGSKAVSKVVFPVPLDWAQMPRTGILNMSYPFPIDREADRFRG